MKRQAGTENRDFDAVLSGIAELDRRHNDDAVMRRAQIHELVTAAANGKTADEALRSLRGVLSRSETDSHIAATEQVILCREYLNLFPTAGNFRRELFFGPSEPLHETANRKISYTGNSYTDEAYRRFSEVLEDTEAYIVNSFDELCENIYGGTTEYGILPVENTDNGRLLRFYSLIDKYDLKISAVCSVNTPDDTETGFALLRKNIEYPQTRPSEPNTLELFVKMSPEVSFTELLTAANLCSMSLCRVDSLPLSYGNGEYTLCPTFGIENADTDTFLLYMSTVFPQYTPVGIYKKLNKE